MGRFDAVTLAVAGIAFVLWIAAPHGLAAALVCLAAGISHLARLTRWAGWRTRAEPLVAILHLAYLFAPTGFLLVGLSSLFPRAVAASAALHAWTAGTIAVMTLAVMTRASLGHSGRPLTAGAGTLLVYGCSIFAALARVADGIAGAPGGLLHLSALLWVLAFAGFACLYWPVLTRPRLAPKRAQPPTA